MKKINQNNSIIILKRLKNSYTWKSQEEYNDFINYVTMYFPDIEDLYYHHKQLSNLLLNTDATDLGYIIYKNTTIIEKDIYDSNDEEDFLTVFD